MQLLASAITGEVQQVDLIDDVIHRRFDQGEGHFGGQCRQLRNRNRLTVLQASAHQRGLRAFDDGEKVYIQFPAGIAQGELPPLFVIGARGDGQLVNYRFRTPYYIVDRLFGAAELRLGADKGDMVRIERTDGWPPTTRRN